MLVGRDAECGRLDRLLAATREGDSAALVIEGEPGIGKSALLEYARERATGMQVLTARGVESEAELPFAGLSQLLTGVLDQLAAIPAPQRDSLQAGLGLAPGSGGDRFAACAATLSLLAAAAEARPLLVIVDDAHWLDQASADALGFTARRLGAEGIALLVAMREGEPDALDTAGLPVLRLGGLDRLACGALLGDATSPEIVARLWWETGGNPLAVLELSTLLEDPQLAGREPLEGPLRVGPQIERAFRRRVDELTEETRRAVLVAAAHDGPALDEVARALEALGLRAAMLEPAERAGIVTLRGAEVVFRHPLVRSAAYHGAPADERRAAHRALAEGLRADRSLARRAWHLAAATVEPDEAVAADLAAAALDARGARRGRARVRNGGSPHTGRRVAHGAPARGGARLPHGGPAGAGARTPRHGARARRGSAPARGHPVRPCAGRADVRSADEDA
jgi:hypothetical protein